MCTNADVAGLNLMLSLTCELCMLALHSSRMYMTASTLDVLQLCLLRTLAARAPLAGTL